MHMKQPIFPTNDRRSLRKMEDKMAEMTTDCGRLALLKKRGRDAPAHPGASLGSPPQSRMPQSCIFRQESLYRQHLISCCLEVHTKRHAGPPPRILQVVHALTRLLPTLCRRCQQPLLLEHERHANEEARCHRERDSNGLVPAQGCQRGPLAVWALWDSRRRSAM